MNQSNIHNSEATDHPSPPCTATRGGPLSEGDYAMLGRGYISREMADAAGLFRVNSFEGAQLIGRNGSNGDYSGIGFAYYLPGNPNPRAFRLRVDNPPLEQKADGTFKPKYKYLSAPGARNMLYFPPRVKPEWLQDTSLPVIVTEGEKKY